MLELVVFILVIALAVGCSILVNKKLIINYPKEEQKAARAVTVVLFLFVMLFLYGFIRGSIAIKSVVNKYSFKLEHFVYTHYGENEFVRNGIDMKIINQDYSEIKTYIDELEKMFPSADELGVPKFFYNRVINRIKRSIERRLIIADTSVKAANLFTDDEGKLTVTSVISIGKYGINKGFNIFIIVIISLSIIIIGAYLLVVRQVIIKEK